MIDRDDIVAHLREKLRKEGLDALLISSPVNVRYVTGFTGDDSMALVESNRIIFLTDFRYVEQAGRECPRWEIFDRGQLSMAEAFGKLVPAPDRRKIGLEADHLTWDQFRRFSDRGAGNTIEPTVGLVHSLRVIKQPCEVDCIRRSLEIAQRAFLELRPSIRPGLTEKDVADHLETLLRRHGADRSGFPTIVAVGPNGSQPHAQTSDQPLCEDVPVLIDWGASLDGYNSDLTRLLCPGRVSTKFEELYAVVLAAQQAAIALVKPGVPTRDVDAGARNVITAAGFGQQFRHAVGHGVGLEVHEAPTLRAGSDQVLQPGMVFTVEPGIYLPGWGGIRIEDMLLVTESGCEVLSSLSRDLESVGL